MPHPHDGDDWVAAAGPELETTDRLGFRFVEYADDHDFQLGPGARTFANLIFLVTAGIIVATLLLGLITPVSVKAPISGQFKPQTPHRVFPKIAGAIAELRVKLGDIVALGDTLAILHAENYEETLADLEFQKSQAEKKLSQLGESLDNQLEQLDFRISRQELALAEQDASGAEGRLQRERAAAVAETEVTKARISLEDARKKAESGETAYSRGIISRNEFDDLVAARRLAESDYKIRLKDLEVAQAALRTGRRQDALGGAKGEEELQRLRAERDRTEKQRELELAAAEYEVDNLDRRIRRGALEVGRRAVVAGAAGVVLQLPLGVGQTASPQALLAEIADLDDLVLEALVTEVHRKRIALGQKAIVKIPTYKDFEFLGEVVHIDPAAQTIQNRSMYRVKLRVERPKKAPVLADGETIRLLPGMSASGDILVDRMKALKYVVVNKMLKRT